MQKLAYFSVYLIFTLINVSSFSVLRFYKFIPKYLINVDANLNGIFKILLSNCSLLRTFMVYSSFPNRSVGKPGYRGHSCSAQSSAVDKMSKVWKKKSRMTDGASNKCIKSLLLLFPLILPLIFYYGVCVVMAMRVGEVLQWEEMGGPQPSSCSTLCPSAAHVHASKVFYTQ